MRKDHFNRSHERHQLASADEFRTDLAFGGATPREADAQLDSNQWCPLSNTAPPKVHMQSKPGIDYLVFWVFGRWEGDFAAITQELDVHKEDAKQVRHASGLEYLRNGVQFFMLPGSSRGSGYYRCAWQLMYKGIYVGVCNNDSNDLRQPIAKIEIKGQTLTQFGLTESLSKVDIILEAFEIAYYKSKISRLDIKVDQFASPMSTYENALTKKCVITRARHLDTYGTLDDRQTLVIGNRKANRFVCRIYDKLAEIKNNPDKACLFYKFITNGEVPDSATRIEFEIRREGFKNLGIDSFEDCFGDLPRIVDFLTQDFLRVSGETVDRNHTERSCVSSDWRDVQSTLKEFARTFRQSPPLVPEPIVLDASIHQRNMEGHLISWLVKEGVFPSHPRGIVDFVVNRFLVEIDFEKFMNRLSQSTTEFQHKLGLAVGSLDVNQKSQLKQALAGVKKIHLRESISESIQKPEDLFIQKELEWIPKQKRAA